LEDKGKSDKWEPSPRGDKKKDNPVAEKSGNPPREGTGVKKKFDVHVFESWCKACGICVAFCPVQCLAQNENGKPYVVSDTCIGCGMCEIRCPDFAITVTEKKEEDKEIHDKPKG